MPNSKSPSPVSSRSVSPEDMMPSPTVTAPESARTSPVKTLPPSPYKSAMKAPSTKAGPRASRQQQNYSLSLVQFTRPSSKGWPSVNIFSILRVILIFANGAGIGLCAIDAKKRDNLFLQSIALKLVFLSFSMLLSIFDLVRYYCFKMPYRVEAVLDLLLSVGFLCFFIIGVLVRTWTTDVIYFVICVFHLLSFFNVLIRGHKISLQLQYLSALNLRDIERGERIVSKTPDATVTAVSSPGSPPKRKGSVTSTKSKRSKTSTKAITAIRSPCAELEGSHRWTIVSEKRIDIQPSLSDEKLG